MRRKNFIKQKYTASVRLTGLLFLIASIVLSCKEVPIGQIATDSIPPASLTDVIITPTYGGAHITYSIPDEEDVSYVKCEFIYNGKARTILSSIYKNYIDVDGIGDPEEIELKLFVIDHSENPSTPYIQKFMPLDPPMKAILNSFKIEPVFGGIKVSWENPAKMMAGISFLAADDNGKLQLKEMVFSSLITGSKSLRGFNTAKRTFALCIVDKFENVSDTFKLTVEPLYEAILDKKNFKDAHLLGDNFSINNSRPIQNIWDGNLGTIWHTLTDGGYSIPQYFSIDLGMNAKLTRIVVYNRSEGIYYYAQHNLRKFDVYGTDVLTHPIGNPYYNDNSWKKDWKLLSNCEIIKPSGSPTGINTPEDLAAQDAGFEFEFTQDVPKMRYIRFVVHETWARTPAMHIAEVSVFGDDRP